VDVYLEQVKDISSIQAVVAQPVQQFHLSARREVLKGTLSKWVGLPLFQLPPVADDVVQVTAECLGTKGQRRRTDEAEAGAVCFSGPRKNLNYKRYENRFNTEIISLKIQTIQFKNLLFLLSHFVSVTLLPFCLESD